MIALRKLVSSVSEGAGTLHGLAVEVEHGTFEKLMSFTLAYGTVLTDPGRTQYAFLSVSANESLRERNVGAALSKASYTITIGRRNFSRVLTHIPRCQRLF